jgi:hypothetical protein
MFVLVNISVLRFSLTDWKNGALELLPPPWLVIFVKPPQQGVGSKNPDKSHYPKTERQQV